MGPEAWLFCMEGRLNAALRKVEELLREKADLEAENARLRADVQDLADRLDEWGGMVDTTGD